MTSFNLAPFRNYVDYEELNFYVIALSPDGGILAMATGTHLLITDDRFAKKENSSDKPQWQELPSAGFFSTIETVLEFSKQSGRCTALCWLGKSNIIAVGFESGDFACFDANGNGIVEQKCDNSAIVSFYLSSDSLPGNAAPLRKNDKGNGMEGDEEEAEPSLWILYETSLVATVPLQSLLVGEFDGLIRFQLLNTVACNDLLILPNVYSPKPNKYLEGLYNDVRSESKYYQDQVASHSIFVAGHDASLSLYNVGGPQHFEHFGKFTEYVKSRTVNYVSRTIFSIFGSVNNPMNGRIKDGSRQAEHLLDLTNGPKISVTSVLDFSDEKRRVLRLSLDPSHRFVATSDSLGRVMVFDTRIHATILVFKGLREARLAWTQRPSSSSEGDQMGLQLALGAYAPRLGLVIFHSIPSGVPLRSAPVGLHCHIVTLTTPDTDDRPLARCFVWRQVESCTALELIPINPWEPSPSLTVPVGVNYERHEGGPGARAALEAELELEKTERSRNGANIDDFEDKEDERNSVEEKKGVGSRAKSLLDEITTADSGDAAASFRSLCGILHDAVGALEVLRAMQQVELTEPRSSSKSAFIPLSLHECVNDMLARVDKLADSELAGGQSDSSLSSVRRELKVRKSLLPVYQALRSCASECLKSRHDERQSSSSFASSGEALLNHSSALSTRLAACLAASKGDQVREEAVAYCSRALRLAAATHLTKQVSAQGSGQSQQGGGSPRGRTTGRAFDGGSDAGGSSPVSASSSTDGYLLSPTIGGSSQIQPPPLKAAVLRSPKENSPLLAGSHSGGARSGAFYHHNNHGSRHGSFESLSSVPTSLGAAPHSVTSPSKSSAHSRVEEIEATSALKLSFSTFRVLFECRSSGGHPNRSDVCLLSEVLHSCAERQLALPIALTVQDSTYLCGEDPEDQHQGRKWTLQAEDWHSFQSLLLMPLLYSPSDLAGAVRVEELMRLHRACGLDNVQGTCLLLKSITTLLGRDSHDSTGVERLLFSLIPLDPDEALYPCEGVPLLKPWLRAVILDIFQAYNDLKSDMDAKGKVEGSMLPLSGPVSEMEEPDVADDGTEDAEGEATWPPTWLLTGLDSLQESGQTQDELPHARNPQYSRTRREQLSIRHDLLVFMSSNLAKTTDERSLASFDEILRFVVDKSILASLSAFSASTAALAVCALFLDVLKQLGSGAPSMQETSTGAVSLEAPRDVPVARTYQHCMVTFRQLRVVLLLSTRSGHLLSVNTLEAADSESIYQLLAADTLRFALTGSAASGHEARCRKTIEKKLHETESDGPLLAFGVTADERWRELLSLVEADEVSVLERARQVMGLEQKRPSGASSAATAGSGGGGNIGRKRRPLLLQFPFHNQPTVLGMHRALVLSSRCFIASAAVSAIEHSLISSTGNVGDEETTSGAVRISPHFLMLATSQLEGLPPTPKTAVALQVLLAPFPQVAIIPLLLRVAASEDYHDTMGGTPGSPRDQDLPPQDVEPHVVMGAMTRHLITLLSLSISQPAPAHEFVQGVLELLLAAETSLSASPSIDASQLEVALENPSRLYLAPAASVCSDLSGGGNGGPWPPLVDSRVSSALTELLTYQASGGTQRRRFARLFSELTLVVFLRFACRLRGARPSELFEPALLQTMYSKLEMLSKEPPLQGLTTLMESAGEGDTQGDGLNERRSEFLCECFSRVSPEQEMSVHFAYRLGLLWGQRESSLMMIHLPVLLSKGLDEKAGDLLGKLQYSDQALNTAIEGLRERAGKALARLRDNALPAYKQIAALGVDDDVLRWALRAAGTDTKESGVRRHASDHPSTTQSLLSCDPESSNVLALLISQKLTHKSVSQQASEGWRRLSGKSNALLILYRALTKVK